MPTHFHFLVKVKSQNDSSDDFESSDEYSLSISKQIAILLRSYTRAINKQFDRSGNLFNQRTNAKPVQTDNYLINLLTYIHQNPIRSELVLNAEEWLYSSYQDYIDLRDGTLPNKDLILSMISKHDLKELTKNRIVDF